MSATKRLFSSQKYKIMIPVDNISFKESETSKQSKMRMSMSVKTLISSVSNLLMA